MAYAKHALSVVSKGAYNGVKNELAGMASKLTAVKKELRHERGTGGALASATVVAIGASGSGALAGLLSGAGIADANGNIMSMPTELILGVAGIGLGAGMGGTWGPWLIEAGSGAVAGFVQIQSFNAAKALFAASAPSGLKVAL